MIIQHLQFKHFDLVLQLTHAGEMESAFNQIWVPDNRGKAFALPFIYSIKFQMSRYIKYRDAVKIGEVPRMVCLIFFDLKQTFGRGSSFLSFGDE